MHFMCGLTNGNALEAERLYRQLLPRRLDATLFARWFFATAQPDFSAQMLFTDECSFTLEDISNTYNQLWASSNPYDTPSSCVSEAF
ncbi:hypothetical protein CEXT_140791 [Caerostris extrusa]|uniref:Sema domain-containing protein n=1 Tax=Caerostris extrusa TaxID=172846 RepID=A0AAV4QE70_CAEEX|nr:hypothetical protein CEXT_140791 [Caerostris extrusa]